MTSVVDQLKLLEVLVGFGRRAAEDFEINDILRDLASAAGSVLAIDGAGVDYRVGDRMEFVGASSALASKADQAEVELQQGPCQDARARRETVVETDLAGSSARWPDYAPRAVAAGVGSVASVPLLARGEVWGALDLYRRQAGPFDGADLAAAEVLANIAVGYLVMAHDRDVARSAERVSAHAATHDALTGLPNRVLLHDRIEHALAQGNRRGNPPILFYLDLNDFKQINDVHGHHIGDLLLVEAARRLTAAVRVGDTVARLGGDEFVVLCEDPEATRGATEPAAVVRSVGARIRDAFAPVADLDGLAISFGASIGAAIATAALPDARALLHAADTSMYDAKRAARHRSNQVLSPGQIGDGADRKHQTGAPVPGLTIVPS